MQTFQWTRKLLGRSIPYSVETEKIIADSRIQVKVYCLAPELLYDMLKQTPLLIGKQLLNLAMDAADKIHHHSLLQDTRFCTYNEKQISLYARFTF